MYLRWLRYPCAPATWPNFGAEVLHIENAVTGDSWRNLQAGAGGGPAGIPSDIPYNWEVFNRNKRGVAIDLSKEGGGLFTEWLRRRISF